MQGEKTEKKNKKKWIVIGVIVVILLVAVVGGGNSGTKDTGSATDTSEIETQTDSSESETQADDAGSEDAEYVLEHGDLVSAITNEIDDQNVLVIKAKISSSYNDKQTVNQNYYNIEDLIQNQGCDGFDEIQYWAVADMSDGSEQKVVSFTVDVNLIKKIAEQAVAANELGNYVSDLYIHPSLSE